MLKLYELTLPLNTNSGDDYDDAHEKWRRKALDVAGGFTQLPDGAQGYWLDGDKLYTDAVRMYRVACEVDQWITLLDAAFGLFGDQLAIFHSCGADAEVITREAWHSTGSEILNAHCSGVEGTD